MNAWTPENRNTNIPRINGDDNNDNMRISDFYVEDGSYFRLKNIQLGYTFPKQLIQKLRFKTFVFILVDKICLQLRIIVVQTRRLVSCLLPII